MTSALEPLAGQHHTCDAASLGALLLQRCAAQPDALAYAYLRDDLEPAAHLTRAALAAQATAWAAIIASHTNAGDRVVLSYPPGLDFVCAFWACLLCDRVAVPVPAPDPVRFKNSAPRLQAVLDDAGATLMLTTQSVLDGAHAAGFTLQASAAPWLALEANTAPAATTAALAPSVDGQALAYLQYTSGSTSTPRGAMLTHANVLAQCAGLAALGRVDASSRMLSWLPHYHDYGLVVGVLLPLFANAPGYLMSPVSFLRRPLRWLSAIERYAITHTGAPNFAYAACTQALAERGWQGRLDSLICASCGAEPIRPEVVRRFSAAFAPHGLGADVFTPGYGMAETVLDVSVKAGGAPALILALDADALDRGEVRVATGSTARTRELVGCGSLLDNVEVRIVAPDTSTECASDAVGELWVRGAFVGRGYWGGPERSADVFDARLADGSGPYLRTGDLGFFAAGQLFIAGRLKDLIIVSGSNRYPQDIEWTMERAWPGLRTGYGAAFSIDGPEGERLVVVQEAERRLDASQLGAACMAIRQAIARDHELPVHAVALVRPGSLPRTSSGKIRRRSCRADYLDGRLDLLHLDEHGASDAPADGPSAPDIASIADRTERRTVLARHCAALAAHLGGIDAAALDPEQAPIASGLDSLRAFRFISALETAYGVQVPPAEVLGAASFTALADAVLAHLDAPGAAPVGAIGVATRGTPLPLSAAQEGLWFLEQLRADVGAYHIAQGLRLRGPIDADALEHSLRALIERHASLRTRFVATDGVPAQIEEADARGFSLERLSIEAADTTAQSAQLEACVRDCALRPFDLSQAPLMRALLVRCAPDDHVLLLVVHHIAADRWSFGVLMRELGVLYAAALANQAADLPPLARQFADYAVWERAQKHDAALAYWRAQLAGIEALRLPTDLVNTTHDTRSARAQVVLPPELLAALRDCAQRQGATLFMLLLATLDLLLMRHSGQRDLTIGVPVALRQRPELAGVVGDLLNTVVLRTRLDGPLRFTDLLNQVRADMLAAHTHGAVPFDAVVAAVAPARTPGRNPLFDVMLNYAEDMDSALALPGLAVERLAPPDLPAKFALSWYADIAGDAGALSVVYQAGSFSAARIQTLLEQTLGLLHQIVADPARDLDAYSLVTPAARAWLPDPGLPIAAPAQVPVALQVLQHAQTAPERIAVRSAERDWTYAELADRAHRFASQLRHAGIGPRDVVALAGERSFGLIAAMLGTLLRGAVFMTLDPNLPGARRTAMLRVADARLLVLLGTAPDPSWPEAHAPTTMRVDASLNDLLAVPAADDEAPLDDAAPAYVFFTSGSTGQPKAILGSHQGLSHFIGWQRAAFGIGAADRVSQLIGLSFDPMLRDVFLPLTSGGMLCLPSADDALDPLVWLARNDISAVHTTPTLLQGWLANTAHTGPLPALRWLFVSGEPLSAALVNEWRARFAPAGSLINLYGPTETTLARCHYTVPAVPAPGIQPVGRTLPESQALVLNPGGALCGIGEAGEIVLRTPFRSLGYLGLPDETRARFRPNPWRDDANDLLYYTGDIGRYREDGELEIAGRRDDQVKIRGVRVEPAEVAAVLLRQPAVRQCAVLARDTEAGKQLVAYVVLHDAAKADARGLRAALQHELPAAFIPEAFVFLDAMPVLPNGKIDRRALPAPTVTADLAHDEHAPRNPREQAVWDIWAEVLNTREFGIHDSFFDLGGHSLQATQVVARLRRALRAEISLRSLFDAPTVAGLALAVERVRGHAGAALPPIVAVARDGALPVSYSQRRMWLVQRFNPETTAYNMPFAVRLRGTLDRRALEQTLAQLVERHEAFRTSFIEAGGEPMQTIAARGNAALSMIAIEGESEEARREQAARTLTTLATETFDLNQAPLHRLSLLRLDEHDHVLLWLIHHAIGDMWSATLLLREFAQLYNAAVRGAVATLPALDIEYADYAHWQRKVFDQALLADQLAYWRERLAGLAPLALPADRPATLTRTSRGANVSAVLAPDTLAALRSFSARHGVTPFMSLLACFQAVLARYTGESDIAVGTPIANRTHVEAEALVGTLVNTLVMRTDLGGDPRFSELLARVQQTALDAYAHQDLPFEKLVEELRGSRSQAVSPLVQVLFNVLNAPATHERLDGLAIERFDFNRGATQFDLSLSVDTAVFGGVQLSYSTDLFSAASAKRLLANFIALIDQVLADAERPLSQYALPSAAERAQIDAWNATDAEYEREVRADALFARQAEKTPEALAVVCGEASLSYRALSERAWRIARTLRARGVGRGQLVGLCLERGLDMLAAQLGVLACGAAYVPLDPAYPPERLHMMAEDAQLALLVSQSALASVLPWPRTLALDTDAAEIAAHSGARLTPDAALDAGPTDPAYVIYTSGSTGRPKGVAVPHGAVANFLASMAREPGLSAADRLLAVTTLSFDIAVLELLLPLSVGAQIVLASRDEVLDGQALKGLIARHGVSVMQATPATWRMLIDAGWMGSPQFKALIGGEGLPADLATQLLARTGQLWNMYGPTETTVWSTCWRVEQPEQGISIGRPIANTQIHVLDERLQPCPIGVQGELWIGGDGVTLGYLHRPDLTAERFVADPFSAVPGVRMYRTGDRGRWRHDGLLEHLGRLDFQVKVRGHRIELGEIEATLASHPEVARTVVLAREDRPGDVRLVAYVVPRSAMPEANTLRTHLRAALPEYMIPQHFVALTAIPLLPNGKIDRKALPAPAETESDGDARGFVAPSTPAEQAIAEIWGRLLGVRRISTADNFFDLGGHSLLAMRAIAEIESALAVRIAPRRLIFESLAQIAHGLPVAAAEPSSAPEPGPSMLRRLARALGFGD